MPKYSDAAVQAALAGRRNVIRYPFPGADGIEICLRLLNEEQLDLIRLRAVEICKKKKVEFVLDPDFLDRVVQRETIREACEDTEGGYFFETTEEVAELDPLLVRTLYQLYLSHQQATDPLSYCSKEEVQELIAQLGKSDESVARLSLLDRPTLLSFALSMAVIQRETSQAPK